jgi:hypothetical protein
MENNLPQRKIAPAILSWWLSHYTVHAVRAPERCSTQSVEQCNSQDPTTNSNLIFFMALDAFSSKLNDVASCGPKAVSSRSACYNGLTYSFHIHNCHLRNLVLCYRKSIFCSFTAASVGGRLSCGVCYSAQLQNALSETKCEFKLRANSRLAQISKI